MADSPTLYTLGHSNMNLQEFTTLLGKYRIRNIVDVRSIPYSRYCPHFNRGSIIHSLEETGISYIYKGDLLGGRPPDSTCYIKGIVPETKEEAKSELLRDVLWQKEWFIDELTGIVDIAAQKVTALLCAEEKPEVCHRNRLLAPPLNRLGVAIMHIRRDGSITPYCNIEKDTQKPQLF